jgi:mono/diheme cytochrome c family protein
MSHGSLTGAAVLLVVAAAGALPNAAQGPADQQQKTVWDGVFTEEQAARGAATYSAHCARCHGSELEGVNGRPLVGDVFWRGYQARTVDYLLGFISKNMPNGAGGSLSPGEYVDVAAFILSRNAFPAGRELTQQSAVGVQIVQKGGSTGLPASALGRIVGCLAKSGNRDWTVTNATAPERTDGKPVPEDSTRELGTRSFPLLFVVTSLDRFVGHRVVVRGLMVGPDGEKGINVTDVESRNATCP